MTRAAIFAYLRERLHVSTDNADAIAEALAAMSARQAWAHLLRAEGHTQEGIGECLGCSQRWASELLVQ